MALASAALPKGTEPSVCRQSPCPGRKLLLSAVTGWCAVLPEEPWRPLHRVCVRQRQGDRPPSADRGGAACQAPPGGARGRLCHRPASLFSRTPPPPNSKALLLPAQGQAGRGKGVWLPGARGRCGEPAAGVGQGSERQSREAVLSLCTEAGRGGHRKGELNRTSTGGAFLLALEHPGQGFWGCLVRPVTLPGVAFSLARGLH